MKFWRMKDTAILIVSAITVLGISLVGLPLQGQSNQQQAETAKAADTRNLPKDVDPDSGSRLPLITREELDDAGKKAFDAASANPLSLAGLRGPTGIRMHSPKLAASPGGNNYLRYETDLGRPLSELTILVTAREMNQQFEWTQHELEGRKVGLKQDVIDVVKYRKPLTGMGEKEAAIIQIGRELFQQKKLSPDTYANGLKIFGTKTMVDMVSLMGQYAGTAILLTTFDQHLPPNIKPLLPLP